MTERLSTHIGRHVQPEWRRALSLPPSSPLPLLPSTLPFFPLPLPSVPLLLLLPLSLLSCLLIPLLPLPPLSSLPLWGGITQENREGGSSPTRLPAHPARVVTRSRLGGGSGPSSGLAVCRERVEGTGLPSGDEGLSAELPGSTTARGQGGLARVWLRLWTAAGVLWRIPQSVERAGR